MNIDLSSIKLTKEPDGWIYINELIGDKYKPTTRLLYDDGSQTIEQHEQRLRLQGSWNIERMSYEFKFFS